MQFDTETQNYSLEQAEQILDHLYLYFHGRNRGSDEAPELLSHVVKHGFSGLAHVLGVIVGSKELRGRTCKEFEEVWNNNMNSYYTPEIRENVRVVFQHIGHGKEVAADQMHRARLRFEEAHKHYEKGEIDKAHTILADTVKNLVAEWNVYYLLAIISRKKGLIREAIDAFQISILMNPDDNSLDACEELKFCYQETGDFDKGLAFFKSVVERFPNRWPAQHECGWMCWKLGQFFEAVPFYQKAIHLNTQEGWGWSSNDLLHVYIELSSWEDAYQFFSEVTSSHPTDWGAWYALGWLAWKKREAIEEALKSFEESTKVFPVGDRWVHGHSRPYLDRGWCLGDAKRYQDALRIFEFAKRLNEDWEGWRGMAWAAELAANSGQASKENYDMALRYNVESLRLKSDEFWSWAGLAVCYRKKMQPQYILSWEAYQQAKLIDSDGRWETFLTNQLNVKLGANPWSELRLLLQNLSEEDFLDLLFDLGIKEGSLPAKSTHGKMRELVDKLVVDGRVIELLVWLRKHFPKLLPSVI